MNKFIYSLAAAAVIGLAACSCGEKAAALKGIDRANLNDSVAPGADFYDYACGGWMAAHPLKPEYSRFGSFDQLGENTREQVKALVEELAAQKNAPGSNAQKVADLYNMGMDSVTLNKQGASVLADDIRRINAANREDLVALGATIPGVDIFFGSYVSSDLNNADVNTMYVSQSGLGLGNRDYYTDKTERAEAVRKAYRSYLTTLAKLIGYNEADAARFTNNVMAVETALAEKQLTQTQLRDLEAQNNPVTVTELMKKYPNIDLRAYFKAQGVDVENMILEQPAYYAAVANILAKTDIQALRDYTTASYVGSASSYLSDDFIKANFELNKVISGVEQMQPRWKRALSVPNNMLDEALGELYVAKHFPASSKEKMLGIVGNLQTALGQHIDSLTWMSDSTKARAHEKLAAFKVKIGYPDKWRDYSKLTIDPKLSYWKNVQNGMVFNAEFSNSDYGKPVDRERWMMSPQTVNAYYNPTTNEICFPAAILQPPFFDAQADDALNYGAIGVVIGHEMIHGFDDQGRQFDKNGNMANWWTDADAVAFNTLADSLVAQFDKVEVAPGVFANGRLTLGENIADQGGLRVSRTAYINSLGGKPGADIDGFSPMQRFYLAYANVWAGNIREAEILSRTANDPHSLGRWRVNATLRNITPFFEAFAIKAGDPMYLAPEKQVIIW